MPLPKGFADGNVTGSRSIRFFKTGNTTGSFEDNAWLFGEADSANPAPVPDGIIRAGVGGVYTIDGVPPRTSCRFVQVRNDGAASLEISYDGVHVHDVVKAGEQQQYEDRMELGISVRGPNVAFRIVGW